MAVALATAMFRGTCVSREETSVEVCLIGEVACSRDLRKERWLVNIKSLAEQAASDQKSI